MIGSYYTACDERKLEVINAFAYIMYEITL
jgi:hypothetical protein